MLTIFGPFVLQMMDNGASEDEYAETFEEKAFRENDKKVLLTLALWPKLSRPVSWVSWVKKPGSGYGTADCTVQFDSYIFMRFDIDVFSWIVAEKL